MAKGHGSGLPTGMLTFLFTDIEGSTRLWEQHPAAMQAAHARHGAIVAAAVEDHNGALVRERGEGDSCFAVFTRATDAVAAVTALQRALAAAPWPDEAPIRVRAALHTGEALLREGDYNSSAVNRCARLRALAAGGQTLLSRVTSELARDHLPDGVGLRDLGLHQLKDLERPERVYQLDHPELPTDFPPLRSLGALPTNLTQPLTSFVGREEELGCLRDLIAPGGREVADIAAGVSPPGCLASPPARLLTLTGTGGVGKTRLAIQVAAEVLDEFADGVWLVELAALTDPTLVPQRVMAVLGAREQPGRPPVEALVDAIRPRRLLLLLDNCEHLVPACATLADRLLRECPGVQILATSREGLGIAGEFLWRVPSLPTPAAAAPAPPEELEGYAAVRLFVHRARASRPGFAVTSATAAAVAAICRRLDGIPLAIELAAARVRALSVDQINSRLDDRFQLLTGGSRAALPRQQTLRAALDWSYDLLSDAERTLLRRLAAFAGGWTLEAAEQVGAEPEALGVEEQGSRGAEGQGGEGRGGCRSGSPLPLCSLLPCSPAPPLLDLLIALVEKSLVVYEEPEDEPRYRLLETVREYAADVLRRSGEEAGVRDRHRDCFAALAEAAEPELAGSDQLAWLSRLEAEHENLLAALEWCLAKPERGADGAGLRLAGSLTRFWRGMNHLGEGRRQLARALAAPAEAGTAGLRAKALAGAGALAYYQGDFLAARSFHEESLARCREIPDRAGVASALNSLGLIAKAHADFRTARLLCEESLAICRDLGDARGTALALNSLGNVADLQGDYAAARRFYEESLAIKRGLGDHGGIASALNNLGLVADSLGDPSLARLLHEESLAIRRDLGDRLAVASSLNNLGLLEQAAGAFEPACRLHHESLSIKREAGDQWGMALSLNNLQNLSVDQGDLAAAARWQRESLTLLTRLGDRGALAAALEGAARLAQAQGERHRMVRLLGAAAALRAAIGAPIPPKSQAGYQRAVDGVRAELGEAAFAAAWDEGQAMTPEAAVAIALEADPIP